ncbi:hypothetical protein Acr_24g0009630 [Actinidia rufa]|uniref:Uncharacterized protein n=1 Tax=Actinidia rufa TaxID=165716 RepID=A0A7J0GVE8_9ERIC|nr:hypothetical protein Acr_24g0009630 [Actinidia rufa]
MRHTTTDTKEKRQILIANNLKMPQYCWRIVIRGKRKDPLSRAVSGLDLRHELNAKRGKEEGDLWVKLVVKATAAVRSIPTSRSEAWIPGSIQIE